MNQRSTSRLLAPVILFIYNRPEHTRRTLEALSRNIGSKDSSLYVFADGAKDNATEPELENIARTRAIIHEKQWCKEVSLVIREKNMNLEDNVIDGVSTIINQYGSAIILEDDIVTSPYFLQYCNEGLERYMDNKHVFSVNGFMYPIEFGVDIETFLSPVATSSWGWATWADRWNLFEREPQFINEIDSDNFLKSRFNVGLQNKMIMLKYMHTWDIRWYYTAFIRNGLGLFPTRSLVENIGFDGSGTHGSTEKVIQSLHMSAVEIAPTDTVNLAHYAKMLSYIKPDRLSFKQKVKNVIKKLIKY